ncbi:malonic semialdehyde reductase [Methylovirgula sp. 4M-Z18]|uniref:malonic semialdehyde reductase n=1 Tax=Methylovirgula sp. 4M-Z18 TaxID=2293567 RepID=UPI000E2E5134|nr:malonic semialdehyde reductase [Methylovirgula sp. 4M-Z18]RFB78082.1 malonic semialdehyde reductase [Methylovirgula sp. 4M-Z18]
MSALPDSALDQLFRTARTHNVWLPKDVPDSLLHQLTDLMKWGPTSANCSPARLFFLKSPEAKAKLKPFLSEGNRDKTMVAPVTVIVAQDLEFYEKLPKLFPQADARSWFAGNDVAIRATAFRNSSLQGGYLILAARALGLDCGPMSGFDADGLDKAFFPDGKIKANFLCNLGYGDVSKLFPRNPRLDFDEFAKIL